MARAMSSLPVPLSPVMSTLLSLTAAFLIRPKTSCIGGLVADDLVETVLVVQDLFLMPGR